MSTFILKRKTFSNEESSGLGKKLAIGAATTAGLFLGAKKGMLGNTGRMIAGRAQMGAGNLLKNKNIFAGGAKTYGKGYASEVNKVAFNNGLNKSQVNRGAVITKNNLMKNFKGNSGVQLNTPTNNMPVKVY